MMVICSVCGMLVDADHADAHPREQAYVRLSSAAERVVNARYALEIAMVELARMAPHIPPATNDDERDAQAHVVEILLTKGKR